MQAVLKIRCIILPRKQMCRSGTSRRASGANAAYTTRRARRGVATLLDFDHSRAGRWFGDCAGGRSAAMPSALAARITEGNA